MTEKAEAKYAQLWAAYVLARAQRRDCLSRELPETAEAFAAQDLSGDCDGPVEAHLAALAAERKTLKKLVKYARKHGADVLPAPAVVADEGPAAKDALAKAAPAKGKGAQAGARAAKAADPAPGVAATPAPATPGGRAPKTALLAAPKVRARAKAGVSPTALATAEVPPTPPARPRRSPAKAKPLPPRGPRGPAKA